MPRSGTKKDFLYLKLNDSIKNIVEDFQDENLSNDTIAEILFSNLDRFVKDWQLNMNIKIEKNIPIVPIKEAPIGIEVLLNRIPKEEIIVKPTSSPLFFEQSSEEVLCESSDYDLVY